MRFLLIPFFFLFLLSETAAQYPANTTAVKLANAIMTRWTTTPVSGRVCIDKMTSKGWEYSNSIVLHGMEKVYNKVNQADYNAYLTYIKTYVDDYVDASGNIVPGEMAQNPDKIHPGLLKAFVY
jgi:unsaturated rhamnogalacturonyl hydrolase